MATTRNVIFSNGYIYHVFNRGVDRRDVFQEIRDFSRASRLLEFYKYLETPVRYSYFLRLPKEVRDDVLRELRKSESMVNILAYCFMPNHFHFMLQQNVEGGIATFVSNFANAYTRYFNTKNERIGPLFEGTFKAVLVETDEQLVHLSRYIHLNPVVSNVIHESNLENYRWSSYQHYISELQDINLIDSSLVLSMIGSKAKYRNFVLDQVDYGKRLERIKHLLLE